MGKQPKPSAGQEENGFKRLGARLAKVTKRSAFSAWLASGSNYTQLKSQIDRYGARWDEIARWAVDEGYTDRKPLTAVAAKRAFERETDRREKMAEAKPKAALSTRPLMAPGQNRDDPPAPAEPARKKRLELKPVTIRKRDE